MLKGLVILFLAVRVERVRLNESDESERRRIDRGKWAAEGLRSMVTFRDEGSVMLRYEREACKG